MLDIDIRSFGYHRSGPPRDLHGNGGGFVFDCRALPNPVHVPALAPRTGLDTDVELFFSDHPQAGAFITHAAAMVAMAMESYLARGYEHLLVSFGCTGGQHRSVYCSERVAERLRALAVDLPVRISVAHAEEGAYWIR